MILYALHTIHGKVFNVHTQGKLGIDYCTNNEIITLHRNIQLGNLSNSHFFGMFQVPTMIPSLCIALMHFSFLPLGSKKRKFLQI